MLAPSNAPPARDKKPIMEVAVPARSPIGSRLKVVMVGIMRTIEAICAEVKNIHRIAGGTPEVDKATVREIELKTN
jgi:hypothetical protein